MSLLDMTQPDASLDDLLGGRINLDPETIEKGLVKLVLMVVETLRQVIERQAIRRVEGGTLNEAEIERLGLALLRLEQKMAQLRQTFGFEESELVLRLRLPMELS
ncbi:MAG TPA: gas vesicle protein K [Rhodocyclaceae bacterium]|nr:gas vesicle protein K [Rhodocyclaceae bacterium]